MIVALGYILQGMALAVSALWIYSTVGLALNGLVWIFSQARALVADK